MRVLIVGGTGNISTSIVQLMLDKGHDVTCFNRGQRGKLPDRVRTIQGDRKDRKAFEQAMQNERFDAAIDMICFDAEDAACIVRAFRGVKHFLQCSTVWTFSVNYDWLPVTEDQPMRLTIDYGRNKKAADEVYLQAYDDDFPVTIVKPSTTYGPQMGVIRQIARDFSWLDRIRKSKPILVCGDGKAVHQFLHIDDAAKGFFGLLEKEAALGQTYNLVNRGFINWELKPCRDEGPWPRGRACRYPVTWPDGIERFRH